MRLILSRCLTSCRNNYWASTGIASFSRFPAETTRSFTSLVNKFTERTHTCGGVSKQDVGKQVSLFGWIKYTRFKNKIIALRDSYGVIQCVSSQTDLLHHLRECSLHLESAVKITGIVKMRPENSINKSLPNGDIEVDVHDVSILGAADKTMPILTREECQATDSANRLKYRYLDLRAPYMQDALRLRSKVCHILRNRLHDLEFVECETPTLFNRTPGGANEFLVPTQTPNLYYSLTQSPQQLKQLLMIGGLDRYFQFSRCYRDESTRSDRQPEFTQVDLELSFTNQNLVMNLVEDLMYHLLKNISDDSRMLESYTSSFNESREIPRMSFNHAIRLFGTDKPDTRFGWFIETSLSDSGLFFKVPFASIDGDWVKAIVYEVAGIMRINPDAIYIDRDTSGVKIGTLESCDESRMFLGHLRFKLANELHKLQPNLGVYEKDFQFVWITEFPLFTLDREGKINSNHHPFTAPTEDSVDFLDNDPLKVVGQHYDLVLNGSEIAGGSIRIHHAELQKKILTDILGVDLKRFDYFIDALESGCPPHGGIAFGLDRLLAVLMKKNSIRDVMAFPKSMTGRDLMSGCPEEIDSDVKKMYHIKH